MFDRSARRTVFFEGTTVSSPLEVSRVAALGVLGTLFRGEIRQLCFDAEGALLVLAGLGVRRLDPHTLVETGRWLPERNILAIHPCGERLWVLTDTDVFLARFGDALGAAFATFAQQSFDEAVAAGTRLAIPHELGVTLLDAASGASRRFELDATWYRQLFSPHPPDRALLSPSGRRVGATVSHGGYLVVWDADTGETLVRRDHDSASALVDDARFIHTDRASTLHGLAGGQPTTLPDEGEFDDAKVRDDRLLLANEHGGFSLYDIATLTRVATLDPDPRSNRSGRHHGRVRAALSATHVATYVGTAGVLRVSAIAGGTLESNDWIGGGETLSLGDDGRRVGVFREWLAGRLDCIDLDAGTISELSAQHEDITSSVITGDGRMVIVPVGSILRARTIHVAPFDGGESRESHAIKSCVHEIVNYGDTAYAVATYTLRGSGYVGLHRAGAQRAIGKLSRGKESPWRVAVGHGGEELLVAWETGTVLYDLRKRPVMSRSWDVQAASVALGPPGFVAFVVAGTGKLSLHRPGARERSITLPLDEGLPRLAFSRDGELLFIGTGKGVLEVRRSDDGTLLRELPLHVGGYVSLRCCCEAIWTMGDDGIVHVVGLRGA